MVSGLQPLRLLQKKFPDGVKVKFLPEAPNVGMIRFKKLENEKDIIQVQFYLLHGAKGADRPVFSIDKSDRWFGIFNQEIVEIWNTYSEVKISDDLGQNNGK